MSTENPSVDVDPAWGFLRHAVATVAYRGGKVLRGVTAEFGEFVPAPGVRSPRALVAHIGDLFHWALGQLQGNPEWKPAAPLPWDQEVERFFSTLTAFDRRLAAGGTPAVPLERLLQGPVADSLTHVGQLAMMRRLAGVPMRSENYVRADIVPGRVGAEQTAPSREFD